MKTLVRRNGNLFPALPSLLEGLMDRDMFDSSLANWHIEGSSLPAVNIREDDEAFEIEMAAPGMKRDDFKVELDHHVLTISSELQNKEEQRDKQGNYSRREFSYQSFQRSFTLPENKIKHDGILAKYQDGILKITVPKTEEAKKKPVRYIAIG
jgi:HSP20 family protein